MAVNGNNTTSSFYRLGVLAHRRRWVIIGIWIAALLAAGPLLGKLNNRLSQGGFAVPGSQSDAVQKAIEKDFPKQSTFSDTLVLHSTKLKATSPVFKATVARAVATLAKQPGVGSVLNPYISPERFISRDGDTAIAIAGLTDTQNQALQHVPALDKAVKAAVGKAPIDVYLAGSAPFYKQFQETTTSDLSRAERIAFPITLVILIIAFGSIVAAGVPLILALLGLAISLGIVSIVAASTTVSIFTENIMSMIGIGVGIDYSLFVLTRFRNELKKSGDVPDALGKAMATSGKAVLVSALTVFVALSGTLLVNIAAFRSMGLGAMIVVFLAGIGALTLLPAVLGALGPRINKWSVHRKTADSSSGVWHRWATTVMRRSWIALFASVAVLLVLALPARHLRLGSSGPSILPAKSEVRVATELVGKAFGQGQVAPVRIVIDDPRGALKAGFANVFKLSHEIAKDPEVTRVDSIATLDLRARTLRQAEAITSIPQAKPFIGAITSADGKLTLISVNTIHEPQSDQVGDLVKRLRASIPARLPHGVTANIGGDPGLNVDLNHELGSKMPIIVGLVMLLSYIVLLFFFRSILLPLKAILMNTASVLATYGVITFIFQEGHGQGLLGFQAPGHIESFLPLFLFCILFGLSMDYEVFLLARVREEYLRTGDNTEAVGWGLEHTAGIITSAAAIMVTVFGAFAFASLVPIKTMGLGLAVAVFLDATIVRVVLVPAAMRLMGHWNWWLPKWLDDILPNVSLEGGAEEVEREQVAAAAV
ncbi:MAG TPA: MMPL family transporter [Actinomycetota bacterium]|nr:MMPL family transporter [Actinomycetota bacterium]